MTNPLSQQQLIEFANRSVPEVWRTQLKKEVQPSPTLSLPIPSPRIATVAWTSSIASGEMVLTISSAGAHSVVQNLLGTSGNCVTEETDLEDVVGELCNMVAGRVSTELRNRGLTGILHPPVLSRTSPTDSAHSPTATLCRTHWTCEDYSFTFAIDIHPNAS
jgi:CheY-specific phosphatase CheX